MNEEELKRIERGDPEPVSEAVIGIAFFLGVVGLMGFILFGAIW